MVDVLSEAQYLLGIRGIAPRAQDEWEHGNPLLIDDSSMHIHSSSVFKASSLLLLLAFPFLPVLAIAESSQVVVSMRQYQEVGPSNIHLYLYTMDGKLVRQLTDNPGLDDVSPMFDRAGKSVFFFRQALTPDLKAKEGGFVLDLNTNKLVKLSSEEAKLQEKDREPTLHAIEIGGATALDEMSQTNSPEGEHEVSCQSPDGNYELIRKTHFGYFLRTKGSSESLPLDSLPGYQTDTVGGADEYLGLNGNPFVLTPRFSALFMTHGHRPHSLWMLDLKSKSWTAMSDYGGGVIYFVPGQTGVMLVHCSWPESHLGLNLQCCYLQFWDAPKTPSRDPVAPNGINYYSHNGAEPASSSSSSATSEILPVPFGPETSVFHGAAIFYGSGLTLILPDPGWGS
jgi:hypothetical protein